MATKSVEQVFNGFLNLTIEEKRDFVDELNQYLRGSDKQKQDLREDMVKKGYVDLGPIDRGCRCCGR